MRRKAMALCLRQCIYQVLQLPLHCVNLIAFNS